MRVRATAAVLGVAFGFLISWGQFTDPDRIRDMLLLRDPYLYLMMFSAIAVAFSATWLLRRARARALLTREPLSLDPSKPERRHVVGSALFGLGWAISDSCPAPIAGQLAQGVFWSTFTIVGIVAGVLLYLRIQERAARRGEKAQAVDSRLSSAAAG
jgi:uncharacterized membrane protein YedE/YeeE